MLWFVCFFNYTDRQAIFSVFPRLKEEFGFDKVQLGLIGSAFMWVYAAGAPLAGFLGDRFRRKDLILGGCIFWSFITITTGWCSKLWHFVTVRAVEGLGETFYFPATTSLLSDYHGGRTRSRALGFHNSSVYVGTIAGGWLGALFAETIGWRAGFYVFGIAGMFLALVLYRFLREPARGQADIADAEPHPPSPIPHPSSLPPPPLAPSEIGRAIFRTPTAFILLSAFMGANFVAAIFLTWTPTFLVEKFHFDHAARGDVVVRLVQGLLRCQHFRLDVRRRRAASPRHRRRNHEYRRMGRWRAWTPGLGPVCQIWTPFQRDREHERGHLLLFGHLHPGIGPFIHRHFCLRQAGSQAQPSLKSPCPIINFGMRASDFFSPRCRAAAAGRISSFVIFARPLRSDRLFDLLQFLELRLG